MYCGIDVAKGKSQVCIMDKDKKVIFNEEIKHNAEDLKKLEAYLTEETIIGMECTGNYSKVIYYYLKPKYQVYYIDNVQMHNYARLRFLHVKNDKVDARLIAEYLMTDFKKIEPTLLNNLQDIARLHQKEAMELTRYKKSFLCQLAVIFPELDDVAYIRKCKAVLYMLLKYPTPKDISHASTEEIYQAIVENLDSERYFTREYAETIRVAAKHSVGVPDYPIGCFKHTIAAILYHQERLEEIKKMMQTELAKTPYVRLLEKRGYGLVSLAAIAGEVGDIRRFATYKKFIKYCGFDVSEKQSGKSSSTHCFITKQGNRYLRSMFYNLTLVYLQKKENEFSAFFKRLKGKGKHTRKCLVAVARKIAVRTYFDMMRCHA